MFDISEIDPDTVRVGYSIAREDDDPYAMPGDDTKTPFNSGVDEAPIAGNAMVSHRQTDIDIEAVVDAMFTRVL